MDLPSSGMPVIFVTLAPVPGTQRWFNKYLLGRWMLLPWSVKLFPSLWPALVLFSLGQYSLSMATFQYWEFIKHIFLMFQFSESSNFSIARKLRNIVIPSSLPHDWILMTFSTPLTKTSLLHWGVCFMILPSLCHPIILTLLPSSVV